MTTDVEQVSFEITNFNDPAGNISTDERISDESSIPMSVTIDVTAPSLVSDSVVFSTSETLNDDDPDRPSVLLALDQETLFMDFETNERVETPRVEINGFEAEVASLDTDAGKQWQASYQVSGVTTVSYTHLTLPTKRIV